MPTDNKKRSSVAVLCCLAISILLAAIPSFAVSPDVVISQVYGGGGNGTGTSTSPYAPYKNDFIELFNRGTSAVDLTGWSVQYASATGSSWTNLTLLSGTIQPGQYFLIQEAAGANAAAAALPTPDVIGNINLSGTAGKVALVNATAALSGTCPTGGPIVDFVGFGTTANCFEGSGPTPAPSNTTSVTRTNPCLDSDSNSTEFTAGAPNPRNSSSTLNVCGGGPIATNPAGTGIASPNNVLQGSATLLTVAVTPGQNPTSSGITVTGDLTPIGGAASQQFYDDATNGDVTAGDNTYSFSATVPASAGEGSKILAVIVADSQTRSSTTSIALTVVAPAEAVAIHDIQGSGAVSPYVNKKVMATGIVTSKSSSGFYLQQPDSEQDADAATSEGIYVYASSPTVSTGDLVSVTGTVAEYKTLTEITGPSITVISSGNTVPAPVELIPDPAGAFDQLERYEGMLVKLSTPKVIGPSDNTGVFYVMNGSGARPFREPGVMPGIELPSGMPANYPTFDGNPERIRVDTYNCKTYVAAGDIVPQMAGPLGQYNGDYTLTPCPYSATSSAPAPTALPERAANEFTVASFNMLNFTSDATRLAKASKAIREVLRTPDVIGVEEVNSLATLQALAAKINADAEAAGQPKPNYAAEMVATSGTQNVGFLYRSDRFMDVSVVEVGRDVLMPDNTTKLNDRPPLVMTAKVTPLEGGEPFPVTVIVNHLRSLIDVDSLTSDYARTKRQLGAEYLANLIAQHQTAGEHVISVGDYNAFEFNDGYVDVLGTVTGKPTAPDQVLLASNDLVDPDLVDLITTLPSEKRYTYVENGSAQALDHIVVTPSLLTRPYHLEVAHLNADFPEMLSTDGTRAERVSDHDVPVAYFTLPPVLAPQVKLSATSLDFGHVAAGSSAQLLLQLTNEGTAALNITSISTDVYPTFSAGTPGCGATLDAGGTCTVLVMFRPQSAGSFTANLSIVSDAKGSPNVVTLSGVGVNTTAKAEPTSIDFGNQVINTEATRTITVTNTGNEPMFVNRMEIQLPSVRNDGMRDCMGALGVGESCEIAVIFRPVQVGPVTGFVMVGGNFETLTINLAGKGIEAPAPKLTVTPASLDFGGQTINGLSNSKTITVANSGTLELNISKIEISGEYTQSNNCPATLAAGAECIVSVNFAPKSTGTKSGTITITHNATGSPTAVALSGSGTDFTVAAPASGSTSATVTPGQTATYNLQIAGTEGFNGPVTLTCAGTPAKTVCTVNPATVNATGSTPAAFTVSVATVAPSTAEVVGSVGPVPGNGGGWPTLLAIGLAGTVMIVLVGRNRKLQWRLTGAFAAVVMVVGLSSCGGNSFKTKQINVPGTAAGTYTLTVTATSGSVGHDIKLTLKVN